MLSLTQSTEEKVIFKKLKLNVKKNVNFYITFTNKLSTPIFLKKFNYVRGKCPNIIIIPTINFYFKKININRVYKFDKIYLSKYNSKKYNNAIYKDEEYFKWRYEKSIFDDLHILEFKENEVIEGYVIIKFSYRKKIKVCYLLDTIGEFNSQTLKKLKKYIFFNNTYLLLILENDQLQFINKNKIYLKFKNQFNFLVKEISENKKFKLSKINLNLSFGDIDFINHA